MSETSPVYHTVECPRTKHLVGEYYLPHASGLLRYVCRCKRVVIVKLHDGEQVSITVYDKD